MVQYTKVSYPDKEFLMETAFYYTRIITSIAGRSGKANSTGSVQLLI